MNSRSNMYKTADHVIIGAGVTGASIAFQLAQRKAGRIVVIDQGFAGQGNSCRSSALVRMHYTYAPEVQLAVLGYKIFSNWEEMVGRLPHFHRTGFVHSQLSRPTRASAEQDLSLPKTSPGLRFLHLP